MKSDKSKNGRRDFLKGAAITAAATVAATVSKTAAADAVSYTHLTLPTILLV